MKLSIPIQVEEHYGLRRRWEPVTLGIPLPRSFVTDLKTFALFKQKENIIFSLNALDKWSDGSFKWVLLDFQADCPAKGTQQYELIYDPTNAPKKTFEGITVNTQENSILVKTEKVEFVVGGKGGLPLLRVAGVKKEEFEQVLGDIFLIDFRQRKWKACVKKVKVDNVGSFKTTIKMSGIFGKTTAIAEFEIRLRFYLNSALVQGEITLRNPRRAAHPGGIWDLGDEGSIYIRNFGLSFIVESLDKCDAALISQSDQEVLFSASYDTIEIYQDSSGGENWQSQNHLNRYGKVPLKFKGYKILKGNAVIQEGDRANPTIFLRNRQQIVSAGIYRFWQNFPSSLSVANNRINLNFYPEQVADPMELQGGEQKTYRFTVNFKTEPDAMKQVAALQFPLIPKLEVRHYKNSKVLGYVTQHGQETEPIYRELVDAGLEGPRNFYNKREIIDEYGWRNFGCVWGDHESVKEIRDNKELLVSHYNNQYDLINGFLLQYIRSNDRRWLELAKDQAFHTIDIDIYHTKKDKAAYNGGLFWHTEHYLPAGRSTHRTYSRDTLNGRNQRFCGGGPSNEHNYTTGLMNLYLLTGNEQAKEAVITLADWVLGMDDWKHKCIAAFRGQFASPATRTVDLNYQGPGRGAGNSINALLDAFNLTKDNKYLKKAEVYIKRCIRYDDDILRNKLDQPEYRWSYLVFLQILGKYLDFKKELNEHDAMFKYARLSLEHYAKWMAEHERPYTEQKEKVLIWTEVWPAQDIRKSCVFDYAAKYSNEPERSLFLGKGQFYYERALKDLASFETRDFTRPLAILMHFGVMHDAFLKEHDFSQNWNNVMSTKPRF